MFLRGKGNFLKKVPFPRTPILSKTLQAFLLAKSGAEAMVERKTAKIYDFANKND